MRKIEDLKANEFKDINQEKFSEWKESRLKGDQTTLYLTLGISVILIIILISGMIQGAIGYFLLALLGVFAPIIVRKIGIADSERLAKEIGLEEKDIREALKE